MRINEKLIDRLLIILFIFACTKDDAEIIIIEPIPNTMATYYVSTTGNDNNAGTITSPWRTWQKGFNTPVAGDIVYIRGGVYTGFLGLSGGSYNGVRIVNKDGIAGNLISVLAYPGETPILDCATLTGNGARAGIRLENCSYWYIKGLTVRNVREYSSTAIYGIWSMDTCDHITYEQCVGHGSSGGWSCDDDSDEITYINCDSYENADYYDNGGFANGFSITLGTGNRVYYRGCRAWLNSDDGWDCFTRFDGGGYIEFDSCWAFENGNWDGETGNGAGFKTGLSVQPPGETPNRVLINCLTFDNTGFGFDESQDAGESNDNSIPHTIYNCTSYNNATGFNFGYGAGESGINRLDIIKNCISFGETLGNFGVNTVENNSWQDGRVATNADFVSISSAQAKQSRRADGSLPVITFLHLAAGSDMIGAGANVGLLEDGDGNAYSSPPALGAYEYNGVPPVNIPVTAVTVTGAGGATTITVDNGTLQMSAHIDPHDATDQTVIWSVVNGSGSANISATGLLTALTDGTVTVTATSNG